MVFVAIDCFGVGSLRFNQRPRANKKGAGFYLRRSGFRGMSRASFRGLPFRAGMRALRCDFSELLSRCQIRVVVMLCGNLRQHEWLITITAPFIMLSGAKC